MKKAQDQITTVAEDKGPLRLIGLSDALFATVLTLLVLDLRIPETLTANGANVNTFVKWLGPHLFGYLLTFLVAGTYWIAHHRNFDHIIRYDRALLGYNLLFLLFIGFLPFTTASVSGGSTQGSEFRFFWSIYAANMALAGLMLQLTWAYAVSHHLVSVGTSRRQNRYISIRQLVTPGVFLLTILLEYVLPQIFLGLLALLIIPLVMWWVDHKYGDAEPFSRASSRGLAELFWRAGRILPWFLILALAIWAITR